MDRTCCGGVFLLMETFFQWGINILYNISNTEQAINKTLLHTLKGQSHKIMHFISGGSYLIYILNAVATVFISLFGLSLPLNYYNFFFSLLLKHSLLFLILPKAVGVVRLRPFCFEDLECRWCCSTVHGFRKPHVAIWTGLRKLLEIVWQICIQLSTPSAFRNPFTWLLTAVGNHFMTTLMDFGKNRGVSKSFHKSSFKLNFATSQELWNKYKFKPRNHLVESKGLICF
jgi:hypothetical protein